MLSSLSRFSFAACETRPKWDFYRVGIVCQIHVVHEQSDMSVMMPSCTEVEYNFFRDKTFFVIHFIFCTTCIPDEIKDSNVKHNINDKQPRNSVIKLNRTTEEYNFF